MEHRYPIRVVAAKTGLSTHLIRMWERRYAAVEPSRTDSKRRLYTDDDINRLSLLRRATQAGASIGQIAHLSEADLEELVASYERLAPDTALKPARSVDAEYFLKLALEAIEALDSHATESALLQASVSLGRTVLLENVLRPLLLKIGDDWATGRLKVAHEHLASEVIHAFLGHIVDNTPVSASAPSIVIATPAGQSHEFGALMVAVTAAGVGWKTVHLGANLPAEDIAMAVRQTGATAVALSIIYPPDDPRIHEELRELRQMIGPRCLILAGGRAHHGYARALQEIGAVVADDLLQLTRVLEEARSGRSSAN